MGVLYNKTILYRGGGMRTMEAENVIEMLHITKEFPGIIANDDITLQLRRGEIHALLGENGAGKSTLMSVLFGLYQPEAGEIKKNGKVVKINNPNDATALGIGMVHQHFQLVDVFTVLDNIILGAETTKLGFLQKKEARKKVEALSEKYGLKVDLDARVENITVGMQQRVEILKMLYRDNEILIFDEPTAVLTPQEIDELMATMKEFAKEGKSILFISHKLNEIMAVADRVTVLRKGKYIGTVDTKDTDKQSLSNMMVGRPVQLEVVKEKARPGETVLKVEHLTVPSHTQKRVYEKSVGRNATLIIGLTPDPDGLLPAGDEQRLKEWGEEINRRFGTPLAETQGRRQRLTLNLNEKQPVNYCIIQEDIAKGERIRQYKIEAKVNGKWQTVCSGESVGHKRIAHFEPVETTALRLTVTQSVALPEIRHFSAYNVTLK